MAASEGVLGEDHVVAFPPAPTAGILGILVREGRVMSFDGGIFPPAAKRFREPKPVQSSEPGCAPVTHSTQSPTVLQG